MSGPFLDSKMIFKPSFYNQVNRSVTFKGLQTIHIPKCSSSLGIAIEGGTNTLQTLPRIISIQPTGAAYQNQDLRVGQLISEVDGFKLTGKYVNDFITFIIKFDLKLGNVI